MEHKILIDKIPDISIVLCTFNRATYLPTCIESVINQTFTRWELLIVDDGSHDDTFTVINPYLEEFENIRYLKHKNRKLFFAKNIGIQASFGNYITFIDSDDTYHHQHLESRWQYLMEHPDVDLVEGGFVSDEEIWVVDYFKPSQTINLRNCVLGPTFFGKRHVFFQLGGFREIAYGEDTDFWRRAEHVFKTHKIIEPQTYVYSRADTSITKSVMAERTP